MPQGTRIRACALLVGMAVSIVPGLARAQGPVKEMFDDDQKRDTSLVISFLPSELPATSGARFSLHVYLSAGDLQRALDKREFRPDAVIIPTNTDLQLVADSPATQRVLIDRVRKQPEVMRDLEAQVADRRKQPPAAPGDQGLLRIGLDSFVAQLPRAADDKQGDLPFPKAACFVPTDFPTGGALDHRGLFLQDRLRKGIAACLTALDAAGAKSLVLPQMGAASSRAQTNDSQFEGQRVLKECRLINATAGIALGIHDFLPARRNLREIGLVQWDREIVDMFKVPADSRAAPSAESAYRTYAEQVRQAFRKGLVGEKTVPDDVNGSCAAILTGQ